MEAKIDRNSNGLTHKGLFGYIFFITQFPSLITHHSSLKFSHPFGIITQFPSHNIFFTLFVDHTYQPVQLFLFFFFFSTQTHRSLKKKKKKKKRNWTANPRKERKKKVKSSQKLWLVLFVDLLYVFNYNIAIELWVMETENSQNVFSVFITYNSKIRDLSNGNKIIVCQTTFLLWILLFLSYELWKLRIELRNLPNRTTPKHPLDT